MERENYVIDPAGKLNAAFIGPNVESSQLQNHFQFRSFTGKKHLEELKARSSEQLYIKLSAFHNDMLLDLLIELGTIQV